MLLSILLQAADPVTINIATELLKQGPVITLLVAAIWYLNKQQLANKNDLKATQEKLETYMADDRQNLITVIQNNTDVMKDIQKYLDERPK